MHESSNPDVLMGVAEDSPLEIRCRYALGSILLRAQLWDAGGPLHEQACKDAHQIGFNIGYMGARVIQCPLFFADEPELAEQWENGVEEAQLMCREIQDELDQKQRDREARKTSLEWLATMPLPSSREILDKLLARKSVEIGGNTLTYEASEGIWITNDYGIDAGLFEATIPAIDSFIRDVRRGGTFGPRDE